MAEKKKAAATAAKRLAVHIVRHGNIYPGAVADAKKLAAASGVEWEDVEKAASAAKVRKAKSQVIPADDDDEDLQSVAEQREKEKEKESEQVTE